MLTIILFLFKFVSGALLLCAFISLIFNPWDFRDISNTSSSKPNKNDDKNDDDFLIYMDEDDD